ncbi:SDR family oxidoreductase [Saccharibacillus qingshengii]|uniref:SDR family oxidoreductase n=1 Tax=Saccharibacillus qingshengii TaxID=1763540 RepID=UPI0015570683|nr:SDR family oxidoreductase [Saccharibacillus qingshengii]
MKVFVTGATGFIGMAVVRELLDAGHGVIGLSRSEKGDAALKQAGAEPLRGELGDLDSLRRGAEAADGVIHLAYLHDFSDLAASVEADRLATDAIGAVLEESGSPFVLTSGMLLMTQGHPAEEADAPASLGRYAEQAVSELSERGIRSSVVRLSPTVHGADDYGFIRVLVQTARDKGVSAYVGDGSNRWPAVHRLDAARLFRLALESAPAGTRLHGVGESAIAFREIAEAIGRGLNLPTVSIPAEEAAAHFGWIAFAATTADNPASSTWTQQELNWHPEQPGLIADLEAGYYFKD